MEKEKEESIWRREIFFAEEKEKEKREGKVRKYLEKENIYLWRRRKNREGKGGKCLEKNTFFVAEKNNGEGKGRKY